MAETKTFLFNPDSGNNAPMWAALGNNGIFGGNGSGFFGSLFGEEICRLYGGLMQGLYESELI